MHLFRRTKVRFQIVNHGWPIVGGMFIDAGEVIDLNDPKRRWTSIVRAIGVLPVELRRAR
jgi:hypothetical protein